MFDHPVRIERVETRRAARAFVRLPYELHRREPNWVAPLRKMEYARWSAGHNSSLASRSVARFLAYRGERVVGRIAAIRDPQFAEAWLSGSGFIGFFDVAADAPAAAALFGAAELQLMSWGICRAIGPINLSTHEEAGLLIDGFEDAPTLLSPWNPPRYVLCFEAAGYERLRDYHAYRWTGDAVYSPAMQRLAARRRRLAEDPVQARARGPSVRAFDPAHFDDDVRLLHGLYNHSFADLWGFVPLSWPEFRERALSFKPFYEATLIRIAEENGLAVGFAVVLPDINEALHGLDGRLLPLGWLRLVLRTRRIRRGRFMLLGVLPAYRGRGVAALLADSVRPLLASAGITELEISLVQQQNESMRAVIEASGCTRSKTFRLYCKALHASEGNQA